MTTIGAAEPTEVTIDGTPVQEITIDGVVAWLAGLEEISAYLEEDWGDDTLTGRSSTQEGVFAHPAANQAGDVLIGRYRPEWIESAGSPSVYSGSLGVFGGETVATTSDHTVGDLHVSFDYGDADSGAAYFVPMASDPADASHNNVASNCYAGKIYAGGSYELVVVDGGTESALVSATETVVTPGVTRDAFGAFELLNAGTSLGTAVDTTHTESAGVQLNSNMTASVSPAAVSKYGNLILE